MCEAVKTAGRDADFIIQEAGKPLLRAYAGGRTTDGMR